MKRKLALTLAAAAGMILMSTPSAFAENNQSSEPPSVKASYDCYGFHEVNGGHGWEGGCSVGSGEIRTVTYCTDGSNRLGGWIYARPNPWFVHGDCGSGAFVRWPIHIETRG
ncbi:hypothetical protein GCM10022224_078420 [Nonomuraea antimicrobica]|uniref:Secreted protein n=1 Tax=Nonomuraea antimicrobica TaxID=561173 RepID=A0ABP7D5B8_9ACTN